MTASTRPRLTILSEPFSTGSGTIVGYVNGRADPVGRKLGQSLAAKYVNRGHTVLQIGNPKVNVDPRGFELVVIDHSYAALEAGVWGGREDIPVAGLLGLSDHHDLSRSSSTERFAALNELDREIVSLRPDLAPPPFLVYGPSGVGKGTIIKKVIKLMPQLKLSVSDTTREPRPGETEAHYHFITQAEFDRRVASGYYAEHATFGGQSYGTPRGEVDVPWLLLEMELQGMEQVHAAMPEVKIIRLELPGDTRADQKAEQRRRLEADKLNPRNNIEDRLASADAELDGYCDYFVVNDDPDRAALEIAGLI